MKKKQVNPRRLTLRGWAAIDDLRRDIEKASRENDWSAVPEFIFKTVELCGEVDRNSDWQIVAELYTKIVELNQPTKKFPVLTTREKGKEMPWEYSGRSWYFWLNLFAKNYGWDMDKIGEMDIDDAIGLFQEIQIDSQMQQEWEYGLSELAYPYNPSTKKSHFKALPRPDWMKPIMGKSVPVKERKIHRDAMPAGTIINLDEQPPNIVQ